MAGLRRRAERYPLHLLSDQPADKLHSQLDHSPHSAARQGRRAASRSPCIPTTPPRAASRDGDVVRVFNDRGACLAGGAS